MIDNRHLSIKISGFLTKLLLYIFSQRQNNLTIYLYIKIYQFFLINIISRFKYKILPSSPESTKRKYKLYLEKKKKEQTESGT